MSEQYTPTPSEAFEATLYTWLDWQGVFPDEDSARAAWGRMIARVKAEVVRDLEAALLGVFEDGTYLAPYTNLTARDVREGIWHYYDQLDEETASTGRRDGEHQ